MSKTFSVLAFTFGALVGLVGVANFALTPDLLTFAGACGGIAVCAICSLSALVIFSEAR